MSVRLRLGSSNAALDAAFDPLVARVLAHRVLVILHKLIISLKSSYLTINLKALMKL